MEVVNIQACRNLVFFLFVLLCLPQPFFISVGKNNAPYSETCAILCVLPLAGLQEEDILDLLEQCELDDEKLTGKSSRQRGPKVGEN